MRSTLAGLLALACTAEAAIKGFNYGNLLPSGGVKQQSDFETEFQTAKDLVGTSGFTSARLYTMIVSSSTRLYIPSIKF